VNGPTGAAPRAAAGATAPPGAGSAEVERLFAAAVGGLPKRAFLDAADGAQRRLAAALEDAGYRAGAARRLALRVVNLVVARHHFHHRHTALASRPFQLMLDPVNNCHLSCPGCLHTSNPAFAGTFDWPGGRLADADYDRFLDEHGPLAFGLVLYNWGEPLLDKRTPELVRRAKRHHLHVCLSTNFSVRFDADALVGSGLNFLFLSLDGATQETYEKFRRGGDLGLCLDNVRRVVEAKRRLGSGVPYVVWRFLTFEHNLHEVEAAMALARELGVDQFSVTTPFAVAWDDPGVRAARSPLEGTYVLRADAVFKGPLDDPGAVAADEPALDAEFARPWRERVGEGGGALDEPSRANSPACAWLYQNLTLDAGARLFPCCMAPETGRHKVYGPLPAGRGAFNVADLRSSRLAFADRAAFDADPARARESAPPYCAVCTEKPELTYTLERDVRRDLRLAEPRGVLGDDLVRRLTEWPASR
jgi:pyruvate-formate lyase-activating enzyme